MLKSGIALRIEERIATVNNLMEKGLITQKEAKKLLEFKDMIPTLRSKVFAPGTYAYWFTENEILLTECNSITGSNWFTINNLTAPNRFIAFGTNDQDIKVHPIELSSVDWFKTQYQLSQEEIDALVKELKESYEQPVTISVSGMGPKKLTIEPEKSSCMFHEWVPYIGLFESFDHCKKCGEKKK
jgi:hypothetical protein